VLLEGGVQFRLIPNVADTPDNFGMNAPIDFGAAATVQFNSDGTFIDQSGNPINGTIFLALSNEATSFRAITILGGTGRVRGYRWMGTRWLL
jgi:hypothetical protein